jgi:L-alanine-DL-glutamate epimerase-like enolase superfamily enzyme
MTINDLELFLVEIAGDGRKAAVRSIVVRLVTDTGLEGWGESRICWRPSELEARRDLLLSALTGRTIFDIEELLSLEILADPQTRCAVEMASWDLVGRAAGQPLCHLFGGGYRRKVPLAVRLGVASSAETAQLARELSEQGFRSQIFTARGQLEYDLQVFAAVREAAGDRTELQFDASAGYEFDAARDLCLELEKSSLQFVLDPLATSDLDEIGSLKRQTNVPLAVRRAIRRPADLLALLRCRAADCVVVDLEQVGGMTAARQCAAIAHAGKLPASLGSGPSLGLGTAAMLQLAAATPAFSRWNECAFHGAHDDLLVESLEITDGMMTVPQGPGLGVDVDRGKVEKYQVS